LICNHDRIDPESNYVEREEEEMERGKRERKKKTV
jgi:hypothetical protein